MKKKYWTPILILIILIFIFFLPTIASSPIGKRPILHALARKNNAKIEASSLHLTWFGPQKFKDLHYSDQNVDLSFDAISTHLPLWKFVSYLKKDNLLLFTTNNLEAKNGHIDLHIPGHPHLDFSEVNANISNAVFSIHAKMQGGQISLVGTGINSLKATIVNLPTFALDYFLSPQKELKTLLGDQISLFLEKENENFTATLHSANIQTGPITGKFQNQTVTLSKPLQLTLHLTRQLSEALLSEISPFFLTGIEARNPIYLTIDSQGFLLSLPFSPKNLVISKATLEMGKIRCQNGGSLSLAVSLFKLNNLTNTKEMDVWFSPVDFSVQDGMLNAGRMDFLMSNTIHLCTWGKINLQSNQLDLTLGIPNDTLESSFGIKNLPKNYVMQVPVRGTRNKPKINLTDAAAKITALTAAQNIPFGGVITAIQKWKEPSVPPAKRPFPWEK